MNNRSNAYTEVYTILQSLEEDDFRMIPSEVVNAIKFNRNLEYKFELDKNLPLKYQSLLPETKAILFNLFRDYLSTPEQKEKILKMQSDERRKLELKKQENSRCENLFTKSKEIDSVNNESNTFLIEFKNESIFEKIFKKIRGFFKKI